MFESVVEAVAKHASKFPDKLCVVDEKDAYSYAQIWKSVRIAAQNLQRIGIKKNDCVIVECTQDAQFLVCDLACELQGIIFVPIEHRAAEHRVKEILRETNAALLICHTQYDVPVSTVRTGFLCLQQEELEEDQYQFPEAEGTAEILYTTGTTGISKGIEITNINNIALAENVIYGTEMKENNVEIIPLPLSHSHGLRSVYANMFNGSTVVLTEGVIRVKKFFEMIKKHGVTAMDMSPSAVLVLAKLAKEKMKDIAIRIDYIQVGTASVQEDVKELLISCFPLARLYNFYGSTESGRSSVLDFNKERGKRCCIGKPAKNAQFIVTDEHRKPIKSSIDRPGLLASSGIMNMKGYWGQEELTRQVMQGGYVYTNDLGYIDEEGYIYVLGRKNEVINYKGIKLAPEEIEESARKYKGIIDCVCVPKGDSICGQIPKLFVVVQDKENFQANEMLRFLKGYVDENKMPKEIEIIEEIPRTYNGKVKRAALMDKDTK